MFFSIAVAQRATRRPPRVNFKGWAPYVDEFGRAAIFQDELSAWASNNTHTTFHSIECALIHAGRKGGRCHQQNCKFKPSNVLQEMRRRRKSTQISEERRQLSFQIRALHKRECKSWRSQRCTQFLRQVRSWKGLGNIQFNSRRATATPPADDFADMLSNLFLGMEIMPVRPALLEDDLFTFQELERAIQSLKLNKSCDECGLAAELLKHTPHALLQILLELFSHVFVTGDVPSTWRRTLFRMLAKTSKAQIVSDFRPVANLHLLYKLFSYMILHRIEPVLDIWAAGGTIGFLAGSSDGRTFVDSKSGC